MPSDDVVRVGSLCSGIGGLEIGLELAGLDVDLVWRSDIEKEVNTWSDVRLPDVPNLGDLTEIDNLPDVDLITAGFPCQPVSIAGSKQGVNDERWLFDDIVRLVGDMESRPYLFLENVPGLLTTGHGEPFRRVIHGLASIGYVGRYGTLAAAQVGAPHLRKRWFCVAHPNEVGRLRGSGRTQGWRQQSPNGGEPSSHSDETGLQGAESAKRHDVPTWGVESDARDPSLSDTDPRRREERGVPDQQEGDSLLHHPAGGGRFGPYRSAVERWERILGRRSPDPLLDRRLNPRFVEWMMGYDDKWVTDVIKRRPALRALGNSVVPQQASAAWKAFYDSET